MARAPIVLGVGLAPYPRTYRELRLPACRTARAGYPRLDVVIWLPGVPDIVVETDSAPNPASAQKLAFTRDASAFPLWVRFDTWSIEKIDGVMVLDIRDASAAYVTAAVAAWICGAEAVATFRAQRECRNSRESLAGRAWLSTGRRQRSRLSRVARTGHL